VFASLIYLELAFDQTTSSKMNTFLDHQFLLLSDGHAADVTS